MSPSERLTNGIPRVFAYIDIRVNADRYFYASVSLEYVNHVLAMSKRVRDNLYLEFCFDCRHGFLDALLGGSSDRSMTRVRYKELSHQYRLMDYESNNSNNNNN